MTPEGICLNRLAVPCGLDWGFICDPTAFSTLSNPQPSEISPQNSNFLVMPSLRTYSKLLLPSTCIVTPLPIHIDGPSTSSQISVPNPTQAATNIFSVEDTSFSLSLDAEFRCFSNQNYSLKPKTRHSLLKELNLAMSDLIPRK
jgi:hypothetical protein